ncbi:MAG: ribonuclease III [SAR202 cluster bacterium]|nr:ribonuclease III [SAR202 cluster bacterium]|tara:strand:+ start:45195 stop:45905 length:711 start_codon:yes stop_codon:yes gene_type:complete
MSNKDIQNIKDLEKLIGLSFASGSLLRQALTHSSFTNETHHSPILSNERMEFLGDAVIGLVVARELYIRMPHCSEGELTELRASVVKGQTLAKVARKINLGKFLILGHGEETSGGRDRTSNLSAALESLFGAVLLERGLSEAYEIAVCILGFELDESIKNGVQMDPKNLLQEFVQAHGQGDLEYKLVKESGPVRDKLFTVEVLVNETVIATGAGRRKIDGEREAAEKALKYLNPKS